MNHNKLISDEFKEKFGYAGSSGTFQGVRDDEIIKCITAQQTEHEAEMRNFAQAIIENDKTERYEYSSNNCDRNAKGELAGAGSRWSTPREMAQAKLRYLETLSNKDVI